MGEGRSLGNAMDFGGSTLGIFACKNEYLRQVPGRIIGMTKDIGGKRAFCMTLQTREQHIRRRRAKATFVPMKDYVLLQRYHIFPGWVVKA